MAQTSGGNAKMRTVVELAHFQHAELTRLLQRHVVQLEATLQGALEPVSQAGQDAISEHRLPAILEVADDVSSHSLALRSPHQPRPTRITLGESLGERSLEVEQSRNESPSLESVLNSDKLARERSVSPPAAQDPLATHTQRRSAESGFSHTSFEEQLVLPADASQKIALEMEHMRRDSRPEEPATELNLRARPISKASKASVASEAGDVEERYPHLRRWGIRLATACVFLNAVVLICELEFIGLYNGHEVLPDELPDTTFFPYSDTDLLLRSAKLCRELDMAFCFIFVVEVAFRIAVERWKFHKEIANWIDTVLAAVGLVDIVMFFEAPEEEAPLLKGIKALRSIRLLRYFRFIDGIRLLFQACQAFLPSLFWSMILLAVFMFVAALTISHLLQSFIEDPSQILEDRMWIWEHYGTAYRSAYTIYECTFAGNWPTYARPVLNKVSHLFAIFFVTYITLIAFALIRVITAVILKDTLDAAQSDAEHQVIERLQKKAQFVEKLEKVFTKLDDTGEGIITETHLNEMLLDPKVKAYFQTLDVDVHEGTALFHILDNGDGEVTLDEFINGILRCKGNARAIDQLAMHADLRQLTKKILQLEHVLNPWSVSPTTSDPRNRKSGQDEYLKVFRVKSDMGDSFKESGNLQTFSRVATS